MLATVLLIDSEDPNFGTNVDGVVDGTSVLLVDPNDIVADSNDDIPDAPPKLNFAGAALALDAISVALLSVLAPAVDPKLIALSGGVSPIGFDVPKEKLGVCDLLSSACGVTIDTGAAIWETDVVIVAEIIDKDDPHDTEELSAEEAKFALDSSLGKLNINDDVGILTDAAKTLMSGTVMLAVSNAAEEFGDSEEDFDSTILDLIVFGASSVFESTVSGDSFVTDELDAVKIIDSLVSKVLDVDTSFSVRFGILVAWSD